MRLAAARPMPQARRRRQDHHWIDALLLHLRRAARPPRRPALRISALSTAAMERPPRIGAALHVSQTCNRAARRRPGVPPRATRLLRRALPGRQRAEQALDELQLCARRVQAQLAQLALQLRLPSAPRPSSRQSVPRRSHISAGGSTGKPLAAWLHAAALGRGCSAECLHSRERRRQDSRQTGGSGSPVHGRWRLGPDLEPPGERPPARHRGARCGRRAAPQLRSVQARRAQALQRLAGRSAADQRHEFYTVVKRGTPADKQRKSRRCAPCCQCIQAALIEHRCKYVTHCIVDDSAVDQRVTCGHVHACYCRLVTARALSVLRRGDHISTHASSRINVAHLQVRLS